MNANSKDTPAILSPHIELAHHVSVAMICAKRVVGHTLQFGLQIQGQINPTSGMITDFGPLKGVIKGFLDKELDHCALLDESHELGGMLKTNGLKMKFVREPTLREVARIVFDKVKNVLGDHQQEGMSLMQIILRSGRTRIEANKNNTGCVIIGSENEPEKIGEKNIFEHNIHLSHRLHNYSGDCHNLHGHTWVITIESNNQIQPDVRSRLATYFEKWNTATLLQKDDKLSIDPSKYKIITFPEPPTTEILGEKIIADLRREFPELKIVSFKLQETPSNSVVWH